MAAYRFNARFSFRSPALWFARARLNETHMELAGWQGLRRYRRRMSIKHILHVDVEPPNGLILWLQDGETIRLTVREPDRLKAAIEVSP